MKSTFILIFLFALNLCAGQGQDVEKISIHFEMFARPTVTYTIDIKNSEMTCVVLRWGNAGDVVFNKKYAFSREKLKKLQDALMEDIPETVLEIKQSAMDGGQFKITYFKTGGKTSELIVIHARPGQEKYKKALQKIEVFFNFAYSITRDPESIDFLDVSYSPYYAGLPVKKTFNNPLEYKVWSSWNLNGREFFNFLDSLPKDKCIIIDCNYNLSISLQKDVLKRYIVKEGNKLRFINNDYLKVIREDLLKMHKQLQNADSKDFEKNDIYNLYMSNPKAMDKWLALPEEQWNMNIRTAIKNCQ